MFVYFAYIIVIIIFIIIFIKFKIFELDYMGHNLSLIFEHFNIFLVIICFYQTVELCYIFIFLNCFFCKLHISIILQRQKIHNLTWPPEV